MDASSIVHRYFDELMNNGDFSVVNNIFTEDCQFRITTIPLPVSGVEGMRGFAMTLRGGFPDIHFTVDHLIVDGDKVLANWRITGTHQGDFLGIPPTGNAIQDHGNDIFHLREGKITSLWVNEDSLGLMRQLGVLPGGGTNAPATEAIPQTATDVGGSPDVNRAVVRRYFEEAMNEYRLDVVDEIIHRDFIFTIPTHGGAHGPEGFKGEITMLHTAFPDVHFYIEDEFADRHRVAVRWVARGTHLGDFLGNAPSGRRFWIDGIGSYRLADGKLIENRVNEDSLNLLIQIGVIPPLGASEN
jgi:steroid delta-isomerase-like uncharacterized protein